MTVFQKGKIAVLMGAESPVIDEGLATRLYHDIRLPALVNEVAMLHEVFVACVRTQGAIPIDAYVDAVVEYKQECRKLPLRDPSIPDGAFKKLHADYLAGDTRRFAQRLRDMVHTYVDTQLLPPDMAAPVEYRQNALAYDTSRSFADLAHRYGSDEGKAELYTYAMMEPSGLPALLGNVWPNGCRHTDMDDLRAGLVALEVDAQVQRRLDAGMGSAPAQIGSFPKLVRRNTAA